MPDRIYKAIEKTYKKLYGVGPGGKILDNTEIDGNPVLIEENFKQNISQIIGYDCPFFGKLMYLYFSKGYDKAKITMPQFFEGLKPYCNEDERQQHNITSFKILDSDKDG